MRGHLILAILSIQGSFSENFERPLEGPEDIPDTLQWWLSEDRSWRIRTFAADHDIHVYSIESTDNMIHVATQNNLKNYRDIIAFQYNILNIDTSKDASFQQLFLASGLPFRVVNKSPDFLFWRPDDGAYITKSRP
jgi:hypothetical protein